MATFADRDARIAQYAAGPARLRAALATVPDEALQWRPHDRHWSAHEVVLHCADSESNAYLRIRYLLGEPQPVLQGYDQDRWAAALDYHALPIAPALAVIDAVRAATVPLLERITDHDWSREGTHTERGRYTVADWFESYSVHLEQHAKQIERIVAAWNARAR